MAAEERSGKRPREEDEVYLEARARADVRSTADCRAALRLPSAVASVHQPVMKCSREHDAMKCIVCSGFMMRRSAGKESDKVKQEARAKCAPALAGRGGRRAARNHQRDTEEPGPHAAPAQRSQESAQAPAGQARRQGEAAEGASAGGQESGRTVRGRSYRHQSARVQEHAAVVALVLIGAETEHARVVSTTCRARSVYAYRPRLRGRILLLCACDCVECPRCGGAAL